MGECARIKATGQEVKIGTCQAMYYLTLGDRNKVDYHFDYRQWWHWRLPNVPAMIVKHVNSDYGGYDDYKEDYPYTEPGDGNYQDWKYYRGTIINEDRFWEIVHRDFKQGEIDKNKGIMQVSAKNGYLINAACYHGDRLPNAGTDEVKFFWNGKKPHLRISHLRTKGAEYGIGISCVFCDHGWVVNLDELEYIMKRESEFVDDNGNRYRKEHWICFEESERMFNAIKADLEDYDKNLPENIKAECETAKE